MHEDGNNNRYPEPFESILRAIIIAAEEHNLHNGLAVCFLKPDESAVMEHFGCGAYCSDRHTAVLRASLALDVENGKRLDDVLLIRRATEIKRKRNNCIVSVLPKADDNTKGTAVLRNETGEIDGVLCVIVSCGMAYSQDLVDVATDAYGEYLSLLRAKYASF